MDRDFGACWSGLWIEDIDVGYLIGRASLKAALQSGSSMIRGLGSSWLTLEMVFWLYECDLDEREDGDRHCVLWTYIIC